MHITSIRIEDVPPFTESVELDFDQRVNVFIGPNGAGKTNLLRTMKASTLRSSPIAAGDEDPFAFVARMLQDPGRVTIQRSDDWDETRVLPWIFVPSVRSTLPNASDAKQIRALDDRSSMHWSQLVDDPYAFDCGAVVRLMMSQVRRGNFFMSPVQTAYRCAADICHEILPKRGQRNYFSQEGVPVPPSFPTELYPDRIFPGSDLIVPPILFNGMGVDVQNAQDIRLFFGDLSSGTQGTLMWIWYVALRIQETYQSPDQLQETSAILLIDEIENHLHPTWQRRVIPALLEHFPGLQIFATTHSPFVVAGLKAGQVHLLNRDENGVVTATTNTEDVVGWTADEILRTMMGVDDPTDDETARNAAELRRLRDEGERADERGEEQRQNRMQELRRLVDRDLLAGGPMARRREEFTQRFRDAMERRRREDELNQDNG